MNTRIATALALVVGAGAAASANAGLVAYWNMNNSTGNLVTTQMGAMNSLAPDLGAGILSIGGGAVPLTLNTNTNGNANGTVGTFAGNVLNAIGADVAGGALVVQASLAGLGPTVTSNGGYIQFQLDMTSLSSLVMTWAGRGTGTGFGSATIPDKCQYSTDGTNFTTLATYISNQTTFALYTMNFGAALDNAPTAYVRLLLDGATGIAGNNRIDNVQFNAVPAPSALALLGLGGLVASRRRRA